MHVVTLCNFYFVQPNYKKEIIPEKKTNMSNTEMWNDETEKVNYVLSLGLSSNNFGKACLISFRRECLLRDLSWELLLKYDYLLATVEKSHHTKMAKRYKNVCWEAYQFSMVPLPFIRMIYSSFNVIACIINLQYIC